MSTHPFFSVDGRARKSPRPVRDVFVPNFFPANRPSIARVSDRFYRWFGKFHWIQIGPAYFTWIAFVDSNGGKVVIDK